MIEKTIKEISDKTGLKKEEVVSTICQWATPLMENGVIVKIEMKRWRGNKKITPEELGLGIDKENLSVFKDYMFLGTRSLLTKKINNRINSIENKARKLLKEYSFDTVWGRFVPCALFKEWQEKNKEIQKSFYDLSEKLELEFDEMKTQVLQDYRVYCKSIWNSGNAFGGFKDYEGFESNFLSKIQNEMITPNEFKKSFKYNTYYYFIPMPSVIEKDILEAKKIQGKAELLEHENNMKKILVENTLEMRERYIESFLESTVGQIRESVLRIIEEVRNSLRADSEKTLTKGSNRTKLLNMIEEVRKLDFYNDEQMQNALNRLDYDLNKSSSIRSEKEVNDILREIECLASSDFTDLIYGRFNLLEF